MPMLSLSSAVLASLLVAAHFLRTMNIPGVVIALALPILFAVKRGVARRILQAGYLAAAGIWVVTIFGLRAERLASGEPWLRMALILGPVAAVSLLPIVFLEGRNAKKWFGRKPELRLDRPVG